MKTGSIFILLIMSSIIATAQKSKFNSIEDSIAIKPTITMMDLSEFSFTNNDTSPRLKPFNYTEKLSNHPAGLKVDMAKIEVMRDGFIAFSSENLKKSFFRDFNITYRRAALTRLLPKTPDYSNYDPQANL
ncbi:hypothetical protein [Winogradskyella sp. 4-2091]|uniref:hypothetical protein n=1 Tax=Winogradskyella sp. 4-2091 TaxID=3381659 RepID=UPI0038914431